MDLRLPRVDGVDRCGQAWGGDVAVRNLAALFEPSPLLVAGLNDRRPLWPRRHMHIMAGNGSLVGGCATYHLPTTNYLVACGAVSPYHASIVLVCKF